MAMLKRPLLPEEQLYFIHIPKCAGTTFINIVDQHFAINEILPTHYDLNKLANEISDDQLAGYRFLRGHIPFDTLIPRLPAAPRLITFLRDPVAQFISYFQMRQRVPDPLVGIQAKLASLSLEEVLNDELMLRFANNATVSIGGRLPAKDPKERLPNLELAKKRLEMFDFVGITERFNDSLDLFSYVFNFPKISHYQTLNVSPDREKRQEISPELMARIAEVQKYDIELYQFGLGLFEKKYASMLQENIEIPLAPVSRIQYDFSRVMPGDGWHIAESHPSLGLFRWSGPETTSILRFPPLLPGNYKFYFEIVGAIHPNTLDGLKITINDTPVKFKIKYARALFRAKNFPVVVEGVIPGSSLENRKNLHIHISIPATQKPENSAVERLLGLCFHSLNIQPTS